MSDICEHGSLKRQCNTCDLNQHISALCKDLDAANEEIEWLRAEMEERNRIIGMSREREARHLAQIQLLRSDLTDACALVVSAGLATGHADSAAQLVAEVLDQVADMRAEIERLRAERLASVGGSEPNLGDIPRRRSEFCAGLSNPTNREEER